MGVSQKWRDSTSDHQMETGYTYKCLSDSMRRMLYDRGGVRQQAAQTGNQSLHQTDHLYIHLSKYESMNTDLCTSKLCSRSTADALMQTIVSTIIVRDPVDDYEIRVNEINRIIFPDA